MALTPDWWDDYMNGQLRSLELFHKNTNSWPDVIPQVIDKSPMEENNQKRPRRCSRSSAEHTEPTVSEQSNGGFQIYVDVKQFQPEEISVKLIDNKSITVEGKHEEGEENDEQGYIFRRMVRHYQLPEGIDKRNIQTAFSMDGVLFITASNLPLPVPRERSIQITRVMGK